MTNNLNSLEGIVKSVKSLDMNKISLDDSHYFETNQKLEDIKRLIDSEADSQKLEGLKRVIGLISKGRDASSLFPAVVKNVISKNVELKKLVYMYLVHYAELEPDSALLAINSFQKDLGAASQYIRASALRVLSSIRVKIIVQIIVLAIQKCVKDTSPYVRKTAAHAISKVYSLDHDQKDTLIEIIKVLLSDRSTLVLGSAVAAFSEVCPERFDLIHPNYKKLCHLLADIDEWGQIEILNMMVRYARNQFEDPNKEKNAANKTKKPKNNKKKDNFWGTNDEEEDEEEESESEDEYSLTEIDPDLRLLLDSAHPLLKNRNSGVVLAVAALYYHVAPLHEAQKVSKSLVRISKSKREIQYVVLTNIASMAASRPQLFESFVGEFFISPADPSFCRTLKLEIITYLVNQDNINKILKEFKTYVQMEDKSFVAATIQAIGRCATSLPDVTDRCLHGLMSLLSNKSEGVVAESVVVIKQLLQMLTDNEEHENTMKEVISHLAKLLDTISVPSARASIVWVIGEYAHRVPKIAPDVLRILAKSFTNEDPSVKLQILNLASKLYLTNSEQTHKLVEYVISLAKYDVSYDVRDRTRILKKVLFSNGNLNTNATKLLLTKKPIPQHISPSEGRQSYLIGSLSHLLSHSVFGYQPLGDFPEDAPPRNVRDEPILSASTSGSSLKGSSEKDFWAEEEDDEDEEDEESYTSEEEYGSSNEEEEEEEEEESYESEEEESEEEEEEVAPPPSKTKAKVATKQTAAPVKTSSPPPKKDSIEDLFNFGGNTQPATKATKSAPVNLMDDLFGGGSGSTTVNGTASPVSSPATRSYSGVFSSGNDTIKRPLLKHVLANGLGVEYSFSRSPSMLGSTINTIQLFIKNHSQKVLTNIRVGKQTLGEGMQLYPFESISQLEPGQSSEVSISIKFTSVSIPAKFEICTDAGTYPVTLQPNIGDLVRAVPISPEEFATTEKSLKGMNELSDKVVLKDAVSEAGQIIQRVLQCAYLSVVSSDLDNSKFQFSGRTMLSDEVVLVSVVVDKSSGEAKCTINSENSVLNAMLLKALKPAISGSS